MVDARKNCSGEVRQLMDDCMKIFLLNRIPVMAPILAPTFGVTFLKGRFSLILRQSESPFKGTCFLIKLKVLPSGLYVFNGQPNMPVHTYLMKTTVQCLVGFEPA
jgi:hypothetical protein